MIVYHGTGRYNLDGLLKSKPRCAPRHYLKGKEAFSTTEDIEIAKLFAFRKSPPAALHDDRQLGVVLEYEVKETSTKGKDWAPAREPGVLQDEKEVAVMNPAVLKLKAVWHMRSGDWAREDV